jgi:hypothetical protein
MSETTEADVNEPETPRPHRLSPRARWIIGAIVVVILAPIVWLGVHAFVAYDALVNAQQDVASLQLSASQGQLDSLPAIYRDMRSNTATAEAATSDPVWRAAEHLPVLGSNLTAVRQVAATIHSLVVRGIGPLAGSKNALDLSQFRPTDGHFQMSKIEALIPEVDAAYSSIAAAQVSANAIDTTHTLGPVTGAIQKFRVLIESGLLQLDSARQLVKQLPPALGSTGARNYLVVLGSNASDRSTGGAAAAFSLVRVVDGDVTIVRTVPASDLIGSGTSATASLAVLPPFTSTAPLTDLERSPDYPGVAAALASAWTGQYSGRVDAVVSLDSVGLGYLAQPVGTVLVGGGKSVTAASLAAYLTSATSNSDTSGSTALNDVLGSFISGKGDTRAYLSSAAHLVRERRLFLWSSESNLQSFVAKAPVAGIVSSSNAAVTSWGLYFNNATAGAVSTSLTTAATLTLSGCATPAHEASALAVTLSSSLKTAALTEDVLVYAPVGFRYVSYSLAGATLIEQHEAAIGGHSVEAFRIKVLPGKPATLTVRHVSTGAAPSATVEVAASSRWQVTPVTLAPCG